MANSTKRLGLLIILVGAALTADAEFRIADTLHPSCSIVESFTLYSEYRSFRIAAAYLAPDARRLGANTAFLSREAYEQHHKDVAAKEAQLVIENPNLIIDPIFVAVNSKWKDMTQFRGLLLNCPDSD